jgi:hypothetical protein
MGRVLRLVETGVDGSSRSVDVLEIICVVADGRQLLAQVQQAVVAAQSRDHATQRPACRTCAALCQVWWGGGWCRLGF